MVYLIDGNAYINVAINVTKRILYRDKSIGKEYYSQDIFNEGSFILKETTKIKFRDFCLNYLVSMIAPVGNISNEVHIVFDSKSWRKEYIKNFFDDKPDLNFKFKYKGTRKKDDHKRLFFEYFQKEIQPHLIKNAGINFHRIDGLEGDDIIACLCETLDDNIVIYTVDKDIIQLVKNKKKYTVVITPKMMTKHKKIYFTQRDININEDFFNLDNSGIGNDINSIISNFEKKGFVKYEMCPAELLLSKIFGGDKSDNLPRLHKMTPSKVKKMTNYVLEKYPDSVFEKIDSVFEVDDNEFMNTCLDEIISLNNIKDEKLKEELAYHFLLNIKTIRLSTRMIPQSINKNIKLYENIKYNKFNYSKLIETKNKSVVI